MSKATDLNLSYGYMWTFSPKWTNKNPEKGRGLGLLTLIIFVAYSET